MTLLRDNYVNELINAFCKKSHATHQLTCVHISL